jgi:hypothetical protein
MHIIHAYLHADVKYFVHWLVILQGNLDLTYKRLDKLLKINTFYTSWRRNHVGSQESL